MNEAKYGQAEAVHGEALEIAKRALGAEHSLTLAFMARLAQDYQNDGKYAEAEAMAGKALEIDKHTFGPEDFRTLYSMVTLADIYLDAGQYAQAEALFSQTLQIQERVAPPNDNTEAVVVYFLGCIAAHRGDAERAFALLNRAVDHGLGPQDDLGIESNKNLTSLHGDPRFAALVARAKQVAEAKVKPATPPASK